MVDGAAPSTINNPRPMLIGKERLAQIIHA
jgi:hypothetical protein